MTFIEDIVRCLLDFGVRFSQIHRRSACFIDKTSFKISNQVVKAINEHKNYKSINIIILQNYHYQHNNYRYYFSGQAPGLGPLGSTVSPDRLPGPARLSDGEAESDAVRLPGWTPEPWQCCQHQR